VPGSRRHHPPPMPPAPWDVADGEEYYTISELLTLTPLRKFRRRTIYRWIASGELPAFKYGRSVLVQKKRMLEFMTKNETGKKHATNPRPRRKKDRG
jgi:excisionase family DNA binding protein